MTIMTLDTVVVMLMLVICKGTQQGLHLGEVIRGVDCTRLVFITIILFRGFCCKADLDIVDRDMIVEFQEDPVLGVDLEFGQPASRLLASWQVRNQTWVPGRNGSTI